MEEKKIRMGLSALLLVGITFSLVGSVFLILGICLAPSVWGTEDQLLAILFPCIGGLFLVIGLFFVFLEIRKHFRAKALVAGGRYIWGTIVEISPNYSITINGRHPYYALVNYADGSGKTHVFRSRNLNLYPDHSFIGKTVKVYFRDESYKHYYVDMEDLLSRQVLH